MSLADNLEQWMTNLPEHLKEIPLIYLAIPGMYIFFKYSLHLIILLFKFF